MIYLSIKKQKKGKKGADEDVDGAHSSFSGY
jgi:hypothetical protein